MTNFRPFSLAVAAAALLAAPTAQAASVQYITEGFFSNNTNTYVNGDVTIKYDTTGLQTANANPSTQVSFGQFNTSDTLDDASEVTVVTGFTLRILQATPTPTGSPILEFVGSITGTLSYSSSSAFLLFDGPLSASIPSSIGDILYSIVSADDSTPGRININPASTNGGLTNISGRITVVPEPSAFALMGLAAPAALLVRRRLRAA